MTLLSDNQAVSILADPFSKNGIIRVNVVAHRTGWDDSGPFEYYARVEFRNGQTKGEQKITAQSFADLLAQTQAFIDSLT